MTLSLYAIETQLLRPGQNLVFVDETEFQGEEVTELVPDLRVVVGLKLTSDHYREVGSRMAKMLDMLGANEFHATEILNPKKGSTWRSVELSERIKAFNLLSDLIEQSEASMRYAWISKCGYSNIRTQMQNADQETPRLNRNAALKRFTLRSLLSELQKEGRPAAILVDSDRPQTSIELDRSEVAPWLIGGGVLRVPSHLVHGIQMADALAYGLGRRFRKRADLDESNASALDYAAIGPVAALNGRSKSLFDSGC